MILLILKMHISNFSLLSIRISFPAQCSRTENGVGKMLFYGAVQSTNFSWCKIAKEVIGGTSINKLRSPHLK